MINLFQILLHFPSEKAKALLIRNNIKLFKLTPVKLNTKISLHINISSNVVKIESSQVNFTRLKLSETSIVNLYNFDVVKFKQLSQGG